MFDRTWWLNKSEGDTKGVFEYHRFNKKQTMSWPRIKRCEDNNLHYIENL